MFSGAGARTKGDRAELGESVVLRHSSWPDRADAADNASGGLSSAATGPQGSSLIKISPGLLQCHLDPGPMPATSRPANLAAVVSINGFRQPASGRTGAWSPPEGAGVEMVEAAATGDAGGERTARAVPAAERSRSRWWGGRGQSRSSPVRIETTDDALLRS